jgi:hypothetical protein
MVNTRRKNQAARGASANAGGIPGEQPYANGPSPQQQQEEARAAGPAMSEQRMTTIEDDMLDLKEMIRKQAEEIEMMNREREAWKKQQEEFQAILVNLGMGQQPSQRHKNLQEGLNPQMERQVSMVGPQIPRTSNPSYPTWIKWQRTT